MPADEHSKGKVPEFSEDTSRNYRAAWNWWVNPRAREICQICRQMVDHKIEVSEAVFQFGKLFRELVPCFADFGHKDVEFIMKLERELQEFPMGPCRECWDVDALRLKDAERARHDISSRPIAVLGAENMLRVAKNLAGIEIPS